MRSLLGGDGLYDDAKKLARTYNHRDFDKMVKSFDQWRKNGSYEYLEEDYLIDMLDSYYRWMAE